MERQPFRPGPALAVALALAAGASSSAATPVFINEIHYDNDGADLSEFIEIAGPAGTDLSGWTLVLYNGSNGTPYRTESISGEIDHETNGFGALAFAIAGLQNGGPDGVALIDETGGPRELLSYEGSFIATSGPASTLASVDIGVQESGTESPGFSLQTVGSGREGENFSWSGPRISSLGSLNFGQQVAPPPVPIPGALWLLGSGVLGLVFLRSQAGTNRRRGLGHSLSTLRRLLGDAKGCTPFPRRLIMCCSRHSGMAAVAGPGKAATSDISAFRTRLRSLTPSQVAKL